jgi:Leucine-rich repeat (LRR) protein
MNHNITNNIILWLNNNINNKYSNYEYKLLLIKKFNIINLIKDNFREQYLFCIKLNIIKRNFGFKLKINDLFNIDKLFIEGIVLGYRINYITKYINLLVNLKYLYIENSNISILPPQFYQLDLLSLTLRCNKIKYISSDIQMMINLEQLNLSNNYLVVIPSQIGLLSKLKNLDLTCNNLICVPTQLGLLSNLKNLRLMGNKLDCVPKELTNLRIEFKYFNNVGNDSPNKLIFTDIYPKSLSNLNLTGPPNYICLNNLYYIDCN